MNPATAHPTSATYKGQRIGYIRVSSADQNTARQLEGVELDRVFTDHLSGKDMARATGGDAYLRARRRHASRSFDGQVGAQPR
jgi:beta-phosphoglucomutase-like phosphatase (HAD superfamily)